MDTGKVDTSILEMQKIIKACLGTGSLNIFGMPFSGKDTQCKLLAAWLDAPVIGGGDILRNRRDLPPYLLEIIDKGNLAPIEDYLKIVTPYLGMPEFNNKPLVLSSVGRWHGEEEGIIKAASTSGHPIKAVVYLKLSESTVKDRWQKAQIIADRGHRADDTYETLTTRLNEFRLKTLPVIDFYRKKNLLVEVNGEQPIEKVELEILSALANISTAD